MRLNVGNIRYELVIKIAPALYPTGVICSSEKYCSYHFQGPCRLYWLNLEQAEDVYVKSYERMAIYRMKIRRFAHKLRNAPKIRVVEMGSKNSKNTIHRVGWEKLAFDRRRVEGSSVVV